VWFLGIVQPICLKNASKAWRLRARNFYKKGKPGFAGYAPALRSLHEVHDCMLMKLTSLVEGFRGVLPIKTFEGVRERAVGE
jgi:hypothetical protein